MKILNKNMEMTTSEYADYITKLLGKRVSRQSVSNMCRKGKLKAYQSDVNGRWIIKVQVNSVPYNDYIKVYKELEEYKIKLEAISGIAKIFDLSDKENEANIYQLSI